ncbi:hypothetical protein UFOVP613_1, partial [uncultured Caudovirales phage]
LAARLRSHGYHVEPVADSLGAALAAVEMVCHHMGEGAGIEALWKADAVWTASVVYGDHDTAIRRTGNTPIEALHTLAGALAVILAQAEDNS